MKTCKSLLSTLAIETFLVGHVDLTAKVRVFCVMRTCFADSLHDRYSVGMVCTSECSLWRTVLSNIIRRVDNLS